MPQNQNAQKLKATRDDRQSIPAFSFKQAFQLLVSLFLVFFVGSSLVEVIPQNLVPFVLLLMAAGMGFSVPFVQFDKKEGLTKTFWIVGSLISVLAFITLYIYYYTNILI